MQQRAKKLDLNLYGREDSEEGKGGQGQGIPKKAQHGGEEGKDEETRATGSHLETFLCESETLPSGSCQQSFIKE